MRKLIFVDRDGTILREPVDYQVDSLAKFAFVDGAILGLKALRDRGWGLVLVSNQDGLGTASFPQKDFEAPQDMMIAILKSCAIDFLDVLICPHFAEANCACRKPKLGLLQTYYIEGFDRGRSAVIGDRDTDVELANALGVRSFKLGPSWTWDAVVADLCGASRCSEVKRASRETRISVECNLDQFRRPEIATGSAFFDHMLEQIAVHSGIGLRLSTEGDWGVDDHHSIEDTALALGSALRKALGDKHGIDRFGFVLPMDEALANCALDLSGRPYCSYEAPFTREMVGGIATEMFSHFFHSLAYAMRATLHIKITGENNHHLAEAGFKVFGRCLKQAIRQVDGAGMPSSKGHL